MQYNNLETLLTNPCFHFHEGSKGKTNKETKKQTSDAPIFWNYCLMLEAEMESFEWKPDIVSVILGWKKLVCMLGYNDHSVECMTNWIEFDGLNFSGLV